MPQPQSAKDLWKRILDDARRELPDHTIRTWLEPTEPIALEEGRLVVGAPDQFAVEWNESKHASLLSRLAEQVAGSPTSVIFQVNEERKQRPQMDFFVAPAAGAGTMPALNRDWRSISSFLWKSGMSERKPAKTFPFGPSRKGGSF